jgi:hypothetical protein
MALASSSSRTVQTIVFKATGLLRNLSRTKSAHRRNLNRPQRGQVNDGEARPRPLHRSSDLKARHVFAVPVHARDHDQGIFPCADKASLIRGDGDGDTFVVQPSVARLPPVRRVPRSAHSWRDGAGLGRSITCIHGSRPSSICLNSGAICRSRRSCAQERRAVKAGESHTPATIAGSLG